MPVLSHRRSVCEKAVAALATGDRSALATLYDCMGRSLFSVAYAVTGNWHDAEDVLQETLLDACRTAPSYRPGTSACAWLLAIARHKALDCVRRTGVRRAETLDDDRAAEEPGFAAVEALDLLRALDEEEREVVILRVYAALPYKELAPQLSDDFIAAVLDCRDTGRLADLIAQNITLRHQDRQRVLEELRPNRRLQIVNDILTHEVDVLSLEMQMEQKVRQRVAQVQKDMILREQVKVLQHELGDDGDEELAAYMEKIQRARLPEEVHKRLTKEVERLAKQPLAARRPPLSATIWMCVWRCRGTSIHESGRMWSRREGCWIVTTTVWKR